MGIGLAVETNCFEGQVDILEDLYLEPSRYLCKTRMHALELEIDYFTWIMFHHHRLI